MAKGDLQILWLQNPIYRSKHWATNEKNKLRRLADLQNPTSLEESKRGVHNWQVLLEKDNEIFGVRKDNYILLTLVKMLKKAKWSQSKVSTNCW